jgi:two-component system, NtrC family, sensor kinase
MRNLADLSYRIKVPLALSAVIVVASAILATLLGAQIYADARRDLLANSESLGRTLARALTPAMLRDDVWQAYETIVAPLAGEAADSGNRRSITVLDADGKIYASSDPARFPMLAPAAQVFGPAADRLLPSTEDKSPRTVEDAAANVILVAVPVVADDGARLGSVVIGYSQDIFLPRFFTTAERVVLSTLVALAVLVPIGWWFGRRMAAPLVGFAGAMKRVGEAPPTELARGLYRSGDEIGQLGTRFEQMLIELEGKQRLEREMVAADRLAAIGRLTAGIAHEINNPLAGMLTAIDTARKHGDPDPISTSTLSLVERGLQQIRHSVSALLVEARFEARALTPQDLDDVRTLLEPEAATRQQTLNWESHMDHTVPLPSTPIRQILINLILNAIQAAGRGGTVSCRFQADAQQMSFEVRNDGRLIPADLMEHLFEPFSSGTEGGSGLGLWVTYQIVEQLRGTIRVRSEPPETEFAVALPIGAAA